MLDVAPVDRRTAQRLATRERVLEASVAEFRRKGFADTDVAAIVQRAQISRGTFYFHFSTKEDVLAELRLREERRIVSETEGLVSRRAPLGVVLRAVVDGVTVTEDRLGTDLVRAICAVQFRPDVASVDSVAEHPVAEMVVHAVAQASEQTTGRDDFDAGDLAVIFLTALFGLLATQSGPTEARSRVIDALIDLTVKGITTP